MSAEGSGVAVLARILATLADGEPSTGAALARRLGTARSTTFDVLRRLEQAGFVERDARGLIAPGPAGARLGFALFGLAAIEAAAEALLPVLRDDTEATAELLVRTAEGEIVLVQRQAAPGGAERGTAEAVLAMPLAAGRPDAILRLRTCRPVSASERDRMNRSLAAVAGALARCLESTLPRDP